MGTSQKKTDELDFSQIRVGIVTPMANEKKTAKQFIDSVLFECHLFNFKSISFYLIFDNICTDGTMDMLNEAYKESPEVNIIFAPENECIVDAYVHGYKEALAQQNDWILEIDAGFSHQPTDIPMFFKTMKQGYDCVFGSRFIKGSKYKPASLARYIISRGGTILTNLIIGTKLNDMTSGFEIFTRATLTSILNKGIRSKGPFFQTEIKTYAHRFKFTEIPISYKDASHIISGNSIIDSFSCLWTLFRKRLANQL